MTGFDYVVVAIELFEASLDSRGQEKPIRSVSFLAEKIGYSTYHFTRLFSAITGVSPKDYMMSRILSVSADRITTSDVPLSAVAREAGFADYETFSRAFRARFSMTPKSLRSRAVAPPASVPRMVPRPATKKNSLITPEPDTVREGPICLAGIFFFMEDSETSFHKPWAVFSKACSRLRGVPDGSRFYQYSAWPEGDDIGGISILCARETASAAEQEPFFACRTLGPATYLRFIHAGTMSDFPATYSYIYGEWFPAHDLVPARSHEFQRYSPDGSTTEICIPVDGL
jgi:AraC family transcriptional regulator